MDSDHPKGRSCEFMDATSKEVFWRELDFMVD